MIYLGYMLGRSPCLPDGNGQMHETRVQQGPDWTVKLYVYKDQHNLNIKRFETPT